MSDYSELGMNQSLLEHKVRIEAQLKTAAGWFFAIAGFSLINSVLILFGSTWHFLLGLGVTTFFDAVAHHLDNSVANIAVFVINVFILAVPLLFGVFARQGHKWAFIVGMVLYALDGVLLLLFQEWLSAGFHVYALFMIYRGVTAIGMLQQIREATLASSPAPIEP
jgi:Na+/melibiose symporter-like transporter